MELKIPIIRDEDVMPKNETAKKCSPHLVFENGSCITLELLIEMAKAYNKYCIEKSIFLYINLHVD